MKRSRHHLVSGALLLSLGFAGVQPLESVDDEILEARRAIQRATAAAATPTDLIRALLPFLDSRGSRIRPHLAYGHLVDVFQKADPAPLRHVFATSDNPEHRIWLAAIADYGGDRSLFRALAATLPTIRDPAARARTAIAVAFKTGDPRSVPHLIAALERTEPLLRCTTIGQSAEFALFVTTNHVARDDQPTSLWNYQCFVMPPPVDPFPAPTSSALGGPPPPAAQLKRVAAAWRDWWRTNAKRSRLDWVKAGIDRDVALLTGDAKNAKRLASAPDRLRHFVGRKHLDDVAAWWASAHDHYRLPERREQ